MHQNVSLRSNGLDRVRSLRKIPKRLRGTNFCTSVGLLCTEFRKATKQSRMYPNSAKCTKTSVSGLMGVDLVRSLLKILTQLRGTNFCTSSAHFAPSFVRKPSGPGCNQIVRNTPKRQ